MQKDRIIPIYIHVFTVIALLFCFFGFCFIGDIRHTVTSSYAILNGHLRDFYVYNLTIPSIAGNDYEIPVYLIFALWNIPVKIAGLATPDAFPLAVMLYNKLLICLVYFLCAWIVRKIAFLMFQDNKISAFSAISFLICPVALFGPFIFTQYDSFYVAMMLFGVYFLLRAHHKSDTYVGILFFSVSILFKPFALIGLIPLLLYQNKNVVRISWMLILTVIPTLMAKLLFPGASGARFINRFLESTITISNWGVFRISIFAVSYILICVFAYFKDFSQDSFSTRITSVYVLFCSYAAFFALVLWHPMWLLIMMPFSILMTIASQQRRKLLLIELLLTAGFAGTTLISWGTNIAEDLVANNILGRSGMNLSEGWTVSGLLSHLPIPFYSMFFAALIADVAIKYRVLRTTETKITPIAALDWRYRMIVSGLGIVGLTIFPLIRYLI